MFMNDACKALCVAVAVSLSLGLAACEKRGGTPAPSSSTADTAPGGGATKMPSPETPASSASAP